MDRKENINEELENACTDRGLYRSDSSSRLVYW
jgi:hypothetical protein